MSGACYREPMDERPGPETAGASRPLTAWWLGRTGYRDAWHLQHRVVQARAGGRIGDQLILLEHEPVLTLGRHSDPSHVRASTADLAARGVELIQTERGGEVTYHGPGQLTAYPIVRLADRSLYIRSFVRALEAALTQTCAEFEVEAERRDGFPGCWCGGGTRKIGAVGVRVERGVTYHGIALNVTVRLSDFDLIDACGMPGVVSTSIAGERGETGEPTTNSVAAAADAFARAFARALGAALDWGLPPNDPSSARRRLADPTSARRRLEALIADPSVASPPAGWPPSPAGAS